VNIPLHHVSRRGPRLTWPKVSAYHHRVRVKPDYAASLTPSWLFIR